MTDPTIQEQLEELAAAGMRRELISMTGAGPSFQSNGREILNFSSNDYLNLAQNEHVLARARQALDTWGSGASASRLLAGNLLIHEELEQRIAEHKGKEACLLFGSGYLTNCGIITSFIDRSGVLIADKLAHACILDGARLAGARIQRFHHNDMDHLQSLLKKTRGRPVLVATESVFSMNGDMAPLSQVVELAQRYGARTLIDEAHSYGIQGPQGCGRVRELGLNEDVDFSMGTLSKGLGSYGGYAACSASNRDWMINKARSLIYSTALPPASVGAALGALEVIGRDPTKGRELLDRADKFRKELRSRGFSTPDSETQIVPVHIGTVQHTVAAAEELRNRGIWTFAIRPPTVPADSTCIRFSITLGHTADMCTRALDLLCEVCDGLNNVN